MSYFQNNSFLFVDPGVSIFCSDSGVFISGEINLLQPDKTEYYHIVVVVFTFIHPGIRSLKRGRETNHKIKCRKLLICEYLL